MASIDLSFSTVQQELPDFIYEGLIDFSTRSNSYHHQPDELRSLIACKYDIDLDSVSLTAGSLQAIGLLSSLHGRQGHIFTPTFTAYKDIRRFGTLTEHASLDQGEYQIATSEIEGASIIFVANPNNPTGITSKARILELAVNNPHSLVVIDEAYGDFAGESVVGEAASSSNLVVLRSFSKGYALAGFRIGYMVARPAVLDDLAIDSAWFNVAYTSVGAAIAALENETYFTELRRGIIERRKQLEDRLLKIGCAVLPSYINSSLIKFSDENAAKGFVDFLMKREIKVNHGNASSNIGLDKSFVRISIGTSQQMEILYKAIDEFDTYVE